MKPSLLLLAPVLLAAGCATPTGATESAAADPTLPGGSAAAAPWRSEGRYFVEPSNGGGLSTTELPFLVNATGFTATATLTVGSRQGPVELPRSTAYVEAQLLDAEGNVLAEARRMPLDAPTLTLEARDAPAGEARLVIGVGGGSDGRANGDYVAFALDAR